MSKVKVEIPLYIMLSKKNNNKIIQLLLLNGADLNIKNNDNKTPWDLASPELKDFIKNIKSKYIG